MPQGTQANFDHFESKIPSVLLVGANVVVVDGSGIYWIFAIQSPQSSNVGADPMAFLDKELKNAALAS